MIRALVMCLFWDYPSMDNGLRGDQKKSSSRIVGRLGGILPQKFLDNVLFNNPGVRYRMSNLMPLVPQLTPGPAFLSKLIGIENFNYIQYLLSQLMKMLSRKVFVIFQVWTSTGPGSAFEIEL